jgi:hypothetical protein
MLMLILAFLRSRSAEMPQFRCATCAIVLATIACGGGGGGRSDARVNNGGEGSDAPADNGGASEPSADNGGAAGVAASTADDTSDTECEGDSDCGWDEACVDEECVALVPAGGECTSSSECAEDLACNANTCGPCSEECGPDEYCDSRGVCVAEGAHAGVALEVRTQALDQQATEWTYEVTYGVVLFDGTGSPIPNEGVFCFELEDFADNDFDVAWTPNVHSMGAIDTCEAELVVLDDEAISVGLVMDQSGSISSTDPTDLRLSAAAEFAHSLELRDESLIISFASGNPCVEPDITLWNSGFSSDHDNIVSVLENELLGCEGGGTPPHDATIAAIEEVAATASNPAQALVVFSDGEDTGSQQGASDVISAANSASLRIFNVGLADGVNPGELSQISQSTDGAFFFADEISTLVTSFRALNHLMRGEYTVFRCSHEVTVTLPETQIPDYIDQTVVIEYTAPDELFPVYATARMIVDL